MTPMKRMTAIRLLLCAVWLLLGAGLRAQEQEASPLIESPRLLSDTLRYHSAPMLLVDPDSGRIVDANEASAKFYGYAINRLVHMEVGQLNVLGEDAIAAERQQALREERNYFVFPHRLADGAIHTVEVYSSPVDVGGRKLLLSVILDTSGRKLAESELLSYKSRLEEMVSFRTSQLSQTHERVRNTLQTTILFQAVIILLLVVALLYRRQVQRQLEKQKLMMESMLDSSLQFMGMLDVEGRLLHANQTALSRFGLADGQGVGDFFWETPWWSHSPEEQQKLRRAVLLAAMGEESRYETTHLLPDGQQLDVDFSVRPVLDPKGKVLSLLVEGRDITSRKQAESQLLARRRELQDANDYLKTLIEAMPDTLMELDASGRIYQFRSASSDMPAPAPDGTGGWTIREALPEPAHRAILAALEEASAQGSSRGGEFLLGDAPARRFELSVSRLPAVDNLPSRFVVLARDVSRRGA